MRLSRPVISADYLSTTCMFSTSAIEKVSKINSAVRGWSSCHLSACDVPVMEIHRSPSRGLYVSDCAGDSQRTAKELLQEHCTEHRYCREHRNATKRHFTCHNAGLDEEWREFVSFWPPAKLKLRACGTSGEDWPNGLLSPLTWRKGGTGMDIGDTLSPFWKIK